MSMSASPCLTQPIRTRPQPPETQRFPARLARPNPLRAA